MGRTQKANENRTQKQAIVIKPQSKAKMAPVRQAILKNWRLCELSIFQRNGIMKMIRFIILAEKRAERENSMRKRRIILSRGFDLI